MNKLTRKLFVETLVGRLFLGMILLTGVLSYNTMVRENYPDLEMPSALVMTSWPGAAPEQIEKEVTKYLEDEIVSLKGLKTFSSGSYNSFSIIAVEFDADMPVPEAMALLRASVDQASAEFPAGVGIEKSEIEEMSISNMPVITWSLSGDVDDMQLSDMAKRLENAFEALPLVKKVDIAGMREKSLHIRLHLDRLRDLGISPLHVRDRLQSSNQDMAWGEFEASENLFNLYLAGRFDDIAKIRQLPITRLDDQRTVRLGELADVDLRLDKELSRTSFSLNGQPFERGVTLDILKRPGADTLAVIDSTIELANQITQHDWPQGLNLVHVSDDGELIDLAFNDISGSMIQAVIIVFFVLMLLLSWREALVAGLALPVTLLAVLAVMATLGYSFNSMIMIGMVLALGLMVDVYILVMEGMHENLFVRKMPFAQASINTVKQFLLPATAGQLTTILAMVPMMMIGGIDGKFIRILPLTITVTLLVSLLVAFLICLPLSSYMLAKQASKKQELLLVDRLSNRVKASLILWLNAYVVKSKRHALAWVASVLLLFVASVFMAGLLPSEMYPQADDRKIGIAIELAPDATIEQSQRVADKAGEFLRHQPWIEKVLAYVGAKSPMTTANLNDAMLPSIASNQVGFSLTLLPKDQRERISFDYLGDIRQGLDDALRTEPGLSVKLVHLGGNPDSAAPIQIDLIGPDYNQLIEIVAQVKREMRQLPGSSDIADNLGPALNEIRFTFKPEALSFHGVSEAEVAQQIRIAMEEDEIGFYKVAGIAEDPKMRLSVNWPSREGDQGGPKHISELSSLQIISSTGQSVKLNEIADFTIMETPRVFVHRDGQRTVTVSARPDGRTADEVVTSMQPILQKLQTEWPQDYRYQFGGEVTKAGDSYEQMGLAFMIAMFSIYVLLTLMFNSFSQPAIILLVVPLALIGTFLGYFLSGTIMSFSGLIGIVSLSGIAVNNGIVLIDTMNQHRKNGESLIDAATLGAAERLRPIISTSLTTILSLLPLAYSDPQWYPLCMAIIYGLMASTVIAIIIIPALYVLLTKDQVAVQVAVKAE